SPPFPPQSEDARRCALRPAPGVRDHGGDMNETPSPRPQPRTLTTTYMAPRQRTRLELPDGWARVGLSAIETIFMTWAVTTAASVAAFATVASNPWMGEATWDQALHAGSDLLALVLGAPLHLGGIAYRATPTLVGVLLVLVLRLLLRQSAEFSAASQWCAVPAFALPAFVIVGTSAEHARWWEAAPGALLIPGIAAAWAAFDASDNPWEALRVPSVIRKGVKAGSWLLICVLALSVVLSVLAVATHWDQIRQIHALLLADSTFANILVVLAQLCYLPSVLAWSLAWILGPGVYVGVDALHSPASAPTLPIPAIPLLGALPTSTPDYWTILAPIGIGIAVGAWWGRKHTRASLHEQCYVAASGIGVLTLVGFVWFASSILVLGDTRLTHVGPPLFPVLLSLIFEFGGGFFAGMVGVHPRSVWWARSQWAISRNQPVPEPPVFPIPIDEEGAPTSSSRTAEGESTVGDWPVEDSSEDGDDSEPGSLAERRLGEGEEYLNAAGESLVEAGGHVNEGGEPLAEGGQFSKEGGERAVGALEAHENSAGLDSPGEDNGDSGEQHSCADHAEERGDEDGDFRADEDGKYRMNYGEGETTEYRSEDGENLLDTGEHHVKGAAGAESTEDAMGKGHDTASSRARAQVTASEQGQTESGDSSHAERPIPKAPVPVSVEELLGTTQHVVPSVKSPAEQLAETVEIAELSRIAVHAESAHAEGTHAEGAQEEED
uniref:cell division protein PerM n=1 Tax=Schaalia cardiffensis TaxID=181487 RepID=UPI0023F1B807